MNLYPRIFPYTLVLQCVFFAVIFPCLSQIQALEPVRPRTLFVNNLCGSDRCNGLKARVDKNSLNGPLASLGKAFALAKTSDRIEVANTGKPYHSGNSLSRAGGTPEHPLIVNGNGALISGLDKVPPDKWKKVHDNIVATPFWPMSNYLKCYQPIQHWIGTPQIWWLDNKPAPNCSSETELNATEGGFYWNKLKRELWVHLPEGKNIQDVTIQIPVHGTGIVVRSDYVVVKNFRCMFSWNDGFDGHSPSGRNVVFKNCIATDNCGQGFSCHDRNLVVYEDCLAERNASSGSCDVGYSNTIYRRCVFINNSFEAGVYTTEHGMHVYEDCLIVGNRPFEQIWQRHFSKMNFHNCVIIDGPGSNKAILDMRNGSILFSQCTIADATCICRMQEASQGNLVIENSLIVRCSKAIMELPVSGSKRISLRNNVYFESPGLFFDNKLFKPDMYAEFQTKTKIDKGSMWMDPKVRGRFNIELPAASPLLRLGRQHGKAVRIGAILPDCVWSLYEHTRREYATPGGIQKR